MVNVGDRVVRVGKSWGQIHVGAVGTVTEVIDLGKKMRVKFDHYSSDRQDGTVIVPRRTLENARPMTAGVTTGRVAGGATGRLYNENRVMVNTQAPIRPLPFDGPPKEIRRVTVQEVAQKGYTLEEYMRVTPSKPVKVASVEHVDLTVPFHKQAPNRRPDWMQMTVHDETDVEGLVGEGFDEDQQHDLAAAIDDKLYRAANPRQFPSPRSLIRPLQPFTAWENAMRTRRFASPLAQEVLRKAAKKTFR